MYGRPKLLVCPAIFYNGKLNIVAANLTPYIPNLDLAVTQTQKHSIKCCEWQTSFPRSAFCQDKLQAFAFVTQPFIVSCFLCKLVAAPDQPWPPVPMFTFNLDPA